MDPFLPDEVVLTMDQLVEGLVLVVKSLFFVLVAIVKCFVPNGILPRKQVNGEIVLITGSGSGLGRLMAYEFGKLGAQLILWDINEQGNEETRKTLAERGTKVTAYTVDLSNRHQINETAAKVKKEIGKVDILINNAGIVTGKKIFDCPDELMEKTMAVNTHALFYTAKNFLPAMLDSNHGHVVTIASMAGKSGVSGLVDYCASKHGAVGFNDSLTSEIKAQGKDVNTTVVCPYYINTGMFDGVETKSPILLPILDQEYVVECIMEAILTNRYFLAMPRFCYVVLACIGFLPTEVMLLFGDYMGVNATMDTFKGRHGKILKH